MLSLATLGLLVSAVVATPAAPALVCNRDNCLRNLVDARYTASVSAFCSTYTTSAVTEASAIPTYLAGCGGSPSRVSSACSCVVTAHSTTTTTSTTSSASSTIVPTTTSAVSSSASSSTTAAPTTSGSACVVTEFSSIAPAVAACTNIVLQDIHAPTNESIDLSKLKQGSVVTFAGLTTFAFTNRSSFDPIIVQGKSVTIQGAPGHLIDGGGEMYWDGIGSNGGVPKPNHFVAVSKFTLGSVIQNLNIKNWPAHCFSISSATDATFRNIYLDSRDGFAPNNRSNGLPASHNSDGFDMSGSSNSIITNSTVINQDDCVALTSGNNLTVSDMYCEGGHGISIGSIGGKSNNNITNVLFTDIRVVDSENGPRIKSNFNTTGFISNITYQNIQLENVFRYGIDIQQDYLNGGPTGSPSNGVRIENLLFKNVTGTTTSTAYNYYILCGDGSCSNFVFEDVHVVGGGKPSTCNFPAGGCPN